MNAVKNINTEVLTTRQEAFCAIYARLGNASEAYKQAGYSCKRDANAQSSAARLMAQPKIKARLAQLAEELASERIAGIREMQERLTSIIRSELKEEQVVSVGLGEGVSEAQIVEKAPMLKDVIKAVETLAKLQGAFDSSATLNVVVPMIIDDSGDEDE